MNRRLRHLLPLLIFLMSLLTFAGCVSPPTTAGDGPGAGDGSSNGDAAGRGERDISAESGSYRFDLSPRQGSPIFLGVSNRLRDREEEERRAVEHIAEQASRYRGLTASYRYVSQSDGRSVGYVEEVDAEWERGLADSLVEQVETISTERLEAGTVVLGTVPSLGAPEGFGNPGADGADPPAWVNTPPRVPGYLVSVGVAQRSRTLRDSVDASDAAALGELLLQAETTLRLINDRREVEGGGNRSVSTMAQEAAATLRDFYVIARYVSGDGGYFYSLAIAREE